MQKPVQKPVLKPVQKPKPAHDPFKGMPTSVRVGYATVKVEAIEDNHADLAGIAGATFPFRQIIYLREGMSAQQVANTFIHEVLHVIHFVYGVDSECDEETFTNLGANGICAFWQDNPAACAWWSKNLAVTP